MTQLDNEVYVKLTVNKRQYRICQIIAMTNDFDTYDDYVSELIRQGAVMYVDTAASLDDDFQQQYNDKPFDLQDKHRNPRRECILK